MAGYTRKASANIADGNPISAQDFNDEYNAIQTAFSKTGGHSHDPTQSDQGAPIEKIGPAAQIVVSTNAVTPSASGTINLGSAIAEFANLYIADNKNIVFNDALSAIATSLTYDDATTDKFLINGPADVRVNNTNYKLEIRDADISVSSSADGQLDIDADVQVEVVAPTIDLQASTAITLVSDAITLGESGASDVVLSFAGDTSTGVLTWMEDEDYFKFDDDILVNGTEKLYFNDIGGEYITGNATDLTIASGQDINLTATADVNIPTNVGLSFATDDAEKIESNGIDLTINSGNDINLTAIGDINIPSSVGITFGDDGEKIEGDGTNLAINSSGDLNVTATGDLNVTATTVKMSNDLYLNSDESILAFGANQDVKITHIADGSGLRLKNTSTLDSTPFILTLQTGEEALEADDLIGSVYFQAPDASAGGDASLVVAKIDAVAEDTFDNLTNTTGISFKTATNGESREIVRIKGDGKTTFNDNDITNVGDIALDTISADGTTINVTMDDNVSGAFEIKEGANSYIKVDTTNTSELITFGQNSTFAGTTISDLGTVTTADIDGGTIDDVTFTNGSIEGATIGTTTAITDLRVDNIQVDGNTISSTDANGNINITPNGDGAVVIDGLSFPIADGTDGQILKTDGSGNLTFIDAPSFTTELSDDTTPQLGGSLDLNGNAITNSSTVTPNTVIQSSSDSVDLDTATNIRFLKSGTLYGYFSQITGNDLEIGTGASSNQSTLKLKSEGILSLERAGGTFELKTSNFGSASYIKSGSSVDIITGLVHTSLSINSNLVSTLGNISVNSGNGTVFASTVDFGATSGNITSKQLTIYEEGTFTPAYTTSDTPYPLVTYTTREGSYTRIGRLVTFQLKIVFDTVSTVGTSDIIITGLPYNKSSTGSDNPAMIANVITQGVDFGLSHQVLYAYIYGTSDSGMKLAFTRDNNTEEQATVSNFIVGSGDTIQIQGSYYT